jgi:hypothetical protein
MQLTWAPSDSGTKRTRLKFACWLMLQSAMSRWSSRIGVNGKEHQSGYQGRRIHGPCRAFGLREVDDFADGCWLEIGRSELAVTTSAHFRRYSFLSVIGWWPHTRAWTNRMCLPRSDERVSARAFRASGRMRRIVFGEILSCANYNNCIIELWCAGRSAMSKV